MRIRSAITAVFCVIAVIVFTGWIGVPKKENPPAKAVKIQVDSGEVVFNNGNKIQKIRAGEQITGAADGSITVSTPPPIPTPFILSDHPEVSSAVEIPLLIQDAMGDPIPAGSVQQGTFTCKFANGMAALPQAVIQANTFTVQAEGYQSQAIAFNNLKENKVTLEYLLNFEIQVKEDQSGISTPNATVKLWQVNTVSRPIRQTIRDVRSIYNFTSEIERIDDKFLFKNTISKDQAAPQSEFTLIRPNGFGGPTTGDQLVNMEKNCCWSEAYPPLYNANDWINSSLYDFLPIPTNNSPKLRIWDTLDLLVNYDKSNKNTDIFSLCSFIKYEFERKGRRGRSMLVVPEYRNIPDNYLSYQTDSSGKCRINNLPIALYLIQAVKEDSSTSSIVPLVPCVGGVILTLKNTSEIMARVHYQSLEKYQWAENYQISSDEFHDPNEVTQISLKSINNKKVYFLSSDIYEKVPYGKYEVEVQLPLYRSSSIIRQIHEVNKPKEIIDIQVTDWIRRSISGVVKEKLTQNTIPEYPLLLENENLRLKYIQKTDSNGNFIFNDIPSGIYRISEYYLRKDDNITYLKNNNYTDYFLSNANEPYINFDGALRFEGEKIEVKDTDINNYEFVVNKAIRTTFSGKVTNEKGSPIQNAELSCKDIINKMPDSKLMIFPENAVTNDAGFFSFSIINGGEISNRQYDFEITAAIEKVIPGYWVETSPIEGSYHEEERQPLIIGSTIVSGNVNQQYDNLVITMKEVGKKSVIGTILSEEKSWESIEIKSQQYGRDLPVILKENNQFIIQNVSSGEILLQVWPRIKITVNTSKGKKEYFKYLPIQTQISIPENKDQIIMDLQLDKAGYAWGTVLDANDQPQGRIAVSITGTKNNKEYRANMMTDPNGFFFIGGSFLLNVENVIVCYDPQSDDPIYQAPFDPNNCDNLIIRIK